MRRDTGKPVLTLTGPALHSAAMDRALRLLFRLVVRPAGILVRARDPLRVRRPESSNFRR
jgi:hypothetical protein